MEPQPSYPTWRDQPDQVLSLIGAILRVPGGIGDDEQAREDEYRQVRSNIAARLGNAELAKEFDRAAEIC